MKSLLLVKRTLLSSFLLLSLGVFLQSCQVSETLDVDPPPAPAASAAGYYGSCGSCPLPTTISGPLSTQLGPNNPSGYFNYLNSCFVETAADLPQGCKYTKGHNTRTEYFDVYIQFAQNPATGYVSLCSSFGMVGTALQNNRPAGNYLLNSIDAMGYLGNGDYRVTATWRSYECSVVHSVKPG